MIFVGIVVLLAAGDLFLKWLIEQQDQEKFPRPLEKTGGRIWLYRNHNAGFPFGFMEKHGELVRTLPLIVISGLGGVFFYLLQNKKGHTVQKAGLAILLGGAASNLYDRYVRRYVVDYFSFQFGWLKKVVFNLGDLFVFAGSGILMAVELAQEAKDLISGISGKSVGSRRISGKPGGGS